MTHTERLQQLHQLLDGELPESQEEGLFWALASDEELRAAFRQLLLLQRLLPHAQPTIPAVLEERIVQQLGHSRSFLRWASQGLPLVFSALGGAAVATLITLFSLRLSEVPPVPASFPEPADVMMVLPSTPSSTLLLSHRSTSPQGAESTISTQAPRALPEPYPTPTSVEVLPSEPQAVNFLPRRQHSSLLALPSLEASPKSSTAAVPHSFSFSVRSLGLWEVSAPEISLPSRAPFGLRDLALGVVLSELSPEHSIGIEVGSEAFSQEFQSRTGTLYRQRPTLLWAGLWYQWTPPTGTPRPFIRTTLGGTLVGPVGKIASGILLPLGTGLYASIGVEATVLAYTFDTRWFVTRKLGLTYGVSLRP